MKLSIEDDFNDIVSKAQLGFGYSTEELALKAGLSVSQVRDLRKGVFEEASLRQLGEALELDVEALLTLAGGKLYPEKVEEIDGFSLVPTPFWGNFVNSYVFWDLDTKEAIAFDTGTDEGPLLELLATKDLKLSTLYLTHTDRDHCGRVRQIVESTGCRVWVNALEADAVPLSNALREGYESSHGSLRIKTIETTGHTAGGTTYLVEGLSRRVAVVGDAVFPGSMGKVRISRVDAMAGLERLLSLSGDTVLASGHGPLTTVAEERGMNCFFRAI
ncbi:MBL fold metallo-hydrolase [Puniceicoccaceae bacterium K14]|nr:MBL fold metallo-hydrolase [Puniceicoccaceae bacterium K14]